MEDYNFIVGQQFSDVKAFRKAIKDAAIAQHFELKIIKSDLIRYFAKCAKDGCPWRIRAVKLPSVPTFTIRAIEGTHTCGKNAQLGHHQASVDWIVNLIEERLRDNMNYKPKDILQDVQKLYGITIPYKQAWRAKERGLAAIYGSSEEGYCLLPSYCEQIKQSNPGSITQLFTSGSDHRFQRLFISFNASIYGFLNGCLPVISFGGIQLKNKYLGSLLSVTSFDGDGGLFPVAFGIVDVETDESWMWFVSEFHKLLEVSTDTIPHLTILSDSQNAIVNALRRKFPTATHGSRYGHLSSNIDEFHKWILEARELPIIQVIEKIHSKLMVEFSERHQKGLTWTSILTPSAEKRMSEAIETAGSYHVLRSDEVEFEVLSSDLSHIVNIGTRTCSCRDWQLYGIPCSHAVAALISSRKNVYEYAEKYFTVESYCRAYSQPIHPVADRSEWSKATEGLSEDDEARLVRPPKFRRPPGRPEKKRGCTEESNREKHTVHCSRCNQTGHYKRTCKAGIVQMIEH
ncbi:uncharacterized protein LOC109835298 [Asparagus officinalis]|uniref:uncharacterized protein LOC109835298 n=1 Tax=Asparagus officinalis TaxID=4686 RepID=UPI00098E5629|nr:uncharacterized protein LOC109835298 [Asparagus officinalis]